MPEGRPSTEGVLELPKTVTQGTAVLKRMSYRGRRCLRLR